MSQIDVFNGDADGICSLHQLRLNNPCNSQLVTGVKRDIKLLDRVKADSSNTISVLDISLDKNRIALDRILKAGAKVEYFDHHYAGEIPASPKLTAHIDTSAETCTSLIVNNHLNGAHALWAVTGAFGDNLHLAARDATRALNLSEKGLDELRHLGECINYNGYGMTLDDLHFTPDALYRHIQPHSSPFTFIQEALQFQTLADGYAADIELARESKPHSCSDRIGIYLLPNEPWARRVSGVFGNELARNNPNRAHALMTETAEGYFRVSVRSPLSNKTDADFLCMKFPTGGGRKGAAGINELPASMFDSFIEAFSETYR